MKRKYFAIILLGFIWVILVIANYKPGTWLSGWDNLHPEFNFSLNINRSLSTVWQEYQGLGLLGGMGHASDLPRQIFLWLASFVFPTQFLRYFYHFLMLLLGPLGVYFLLKDVILEKHSNSSTSEEGFAHHPRCLFGLLPFDKQAAAFLGAVFYLFNLATLQMFYVPYEAYSTHFGFLPWLFLVFFNFLKKGDRKSLFFLCLVNFLSAPQGYVATFFLVYVLSITILSLGYFLLRREIKKIFIAYFVIFLINAFWLLPNLYFVFKKTDVNIEAKINQMSTEDNFLRNKKYGNLADTALLRGFWFDNLETNKEGKMDFQMGEWVTHLKNPLTLGTGYSLFALSLIGVFFAFKKRMKFILLFFPVLLFSFTILSNDTPIFSFFTSLFYKLPLFPQIFRFPFTKFAILTAFCLSIFFAVASLSLASFVKNSRLRMVVFFFLAVLPLIFCYPMLLGKLFYQKTRVKIPNEYFQVFDFFQKEKTGGRIANFPQYTFWGWTFYRWPARRSLNEGGDYSGSGFLWYGVKNPILDRAFDVWGRENENYYHEISYALYSGNTDLFEKVLEKYQVRWLLVDENVISPPSAKAAYIDEIQEMISQSKNIVLKETFGKIKIYKVILVTEPDNFVFLAKDLPKVRPKYEWNNNDQAFREYGNYVEPTTNNQQPTTIFYPFRSLFTGRKQEELEFQIEDKADYFSFKSKVPKEFSDGELILPPLNPEEITEIDENDLTKTLEKPAVVFLDKEKGVLEVKAPKIWGFLSYKSDKTEAAVYLPNLSHKISYLITTQSRNIAGKSLLFWLENLNSRRADLETYLPKGQKLTTSYFIQPAMENYGQGYSLHFDNISIGRTKTVNELGRITINPIPYRFLTGIKIEKHLPGGVAPAAHLEGGRNIDISHPNPSYYQISLRFPASEVSLSPSDNTYLILSQSFDKGWRVYETKSQIASYLPFFFGKELKDHVLVNNWENGWLLTPATDNPSFDFAQDKQPTTIVIVYLPQYLEYLGFGLLLLTFPLIALKYN